MHPVPFQISRHFPLPASTELPHLPEEFGVDSPTGTAQNIGRFATSTFNDRYRTDSAGKHYCNANGTTCLVKT